MEPLFVPLPDNLAELTAAQIREWIDANLALIDRVVEGDTELIGDRTAAQVESEMVDVVAAIGQAREQLVEVEAQENQPERLAALAAQARTETTTTTTTEADQGGDQGQQTPAPDQGDGQGGQQGGQQDQGGQSDQGGQQADQGAQGQQASGVPTRQRPPAASPDRTPQADRDRHAMTAAAGVRGVQAGQPLDRRGVAQALVAAAQNLGQTTPAGDGQKVTVATMESGIPEDRRLTASADPRANFEQLEAVIGQDALTAAGGLCAPVGVYYDLADYGVTDRPVRDALPAFAAERGGVRFATPPRLSDITTAVGVVTAANDALGGTNAAKTCQRIVCPPFSEVDVASIYHCITAGNLGARAYPEQVAQFTDLVMQLWARTAEQRILDRIAAYSTAVTYARQLGLVDMLAAIITAGAGQRNRHRMDPDRPLQCLLPAWVIDAGAVDDDRTPFDLERDIRQELGERNIVPSFYIDGPTGASQLFGAQTAGPLLRFPGTVRAFLFPPGSFLWLDGGQLELGLVRDSTLNAQNDYQMFGESWEETFFVGVESLQLTIDFCATGALAAPVTNTGC